MTVQELLDLVKVYSQAQVVDGATELAIVFADGADASQRHPVEMVTAEVGSKALTVWARRAPAAGGGDSEGAARPEPGTAPGDAAAP